MINWIDYRLVAAVQGLWLTMLTPMMLVLLLRVVTAVYNE